jgi:hypothetical protein
MGSFGVGMPVMVATMGRREQPPHHGTGAFAPPQHPQEQITLESTPKPFSPSMSTEPTIQQCIMDFKELVSSPGKGVTSRVLNWFGNLDSLGLLPESLLLVTR